MTALLRGVPRSGREGGQGGRRGGGLQEQLIGPVPPPLRRRTADRPPADHPLLPLHGPLPEDVIPSERRRRPRAARGQPPTAPGAAAEPTGLAGSGRICPLRTDHLRYVQPDRADPFHGKLLPLWRRAAITVGQRDAGSRGRPPCNYPHLSLSDQWFAGYPRGRVLP